MARGKEDKMNGKKKLTPNEVGVLEGMRVLALRDTCENAIIQK